MLSEGFKMNLLYNYRREIQRKMVYPGYDNQQNLVSRLQFCSYGECVVPLHCKLLTSLLQPKGVVPVQVPYTVQIELVENY